MKLTPMDINNKEFKKSLRGYNPDEVDEFLDQIVDSYEELYKTNLQLKEKLQDTNEKVEHYADIEATIKNTLLLAQNAAEQAKASAKKESEILVKNANETAQKILDKAHNDVLVINDEYGKVKQEFIKFRTKYRNFMTVQMDTFEALEKDFMKNTNITEPVDENEENSGRNEEIETNAEKLDKKVCEKEAMIKEENSDAVKSETKEDKVADDELSQIKSFFVNEK
ncbi:DivIVA domain-containing protein [Clostridium sp. BJN0001]|uniref:DivIVA domain-containing protein n=1 Tax=Clostridium sp. BJN0001 TaxID=2930219 RepID=UPI001FD26471|nr:DivIVA domain-containing protein [Clostridium sp. BJN0001]